MSTTSAASSSTPASRTAAVKETRQSIVEWAASIGDVPMSRIVFDPWPGTATEHDLLTFAERDKRFCELIDGVLVEKAVGFFEGVIGSRLSRHVGNFVEPRRLGVVVGEGGTLMMRVGRVRMPDVSFIAREALPGGRVPHDPIPLLPPTLAVEVLSVTNTRREMQQKLREYFESGCKLAWIIDPPTQTCEVYRTPGEPTRRLTAADDLDGEDVLPGFRLRLGELFVDL